jgi:F-type H+-transporting ATPase subunit delta
VSAAVARTYSKALLEAAGTDAGRIADELEAFTALAESAPDEWNQLVGPGIPAEVRKSALDRLMADATPTTRNVLKVLVDNGRLADATELAIEFRRLVRERDKQLDVHVTTSIQLSDELRTTLEQRLSDSTGKQVNLHASVDPEIIGGLIVRYGDTLVDTSLKGRLESMRQQLSRPSARPTSSTD